MPPKRKTFAGAKKKKTPSSSPRSAAKTASPANDKPLKYTPGYHPPVGLMNDPILPNGGLDTMKEDFKAFGFSDEKIDSLMAIDERPVDSCTQTLHGSFAREKESKNKRVKDFFRKRTRRQSQMSASRRGDVDNVDKKRGRQQIKIRGDWVLFDDCRGPPPMSSEMPQSYKKFARYEPGNNKILAYNLETFSVALRKTPAAFEGNVVQYLKAGPKLAKMKRERKEFR